MPTLHLLITHYSLLITRSLCACACACEALPERSALPVPVPEGTTVRSGTTARSGAAVSFRTNFLQFRRSSFLRK